VSLQYALEWDTTLITLENVIQGEQLVEPFSEGSFDGWTLDASKNGILQFFGNKIEGLSLDTTDLNYQLCFRAKQQVDEISFQFRDDVLKREGFNTDLQFVPIQLIRGETNVSDGSNNGGEVGTGDLTIAFDTIRVSENYGLCVPVSVSGFEGILGMQYTHHWDPAVLRFDSIRIRTLNNGLSSVNFGTAVGVENGDLTFSWTPRNPNLNDGSILYDLCFTPIGIEGDSSVITIDGNPTEIEVVYEGDIVEDTLNINNGLVKIDNDFVWPGDTDVDGVANHFDLLNIGIAHSQSGLDRFDQEIVWLPLESDDWWQKTPESQVDFKHIDTNGDGMITNADTSAITLNWGKETSWRRNVIEFKEEMSENGTPILVAPTTSFDKGENTFELLLGNEEMPATEVYGLAFSVYYDYAGINAEQVSVDFSNSWLGIEGQDLIAIQRNDPQARRIDIALTRIDGQNVTGSGPIANLHVTIEDIILFSAEELPGIIFTIDDVKLIDVLEEEKPTSPETTTIENISTSANNLAISKKVRIYPNPSSDFLFIDPSEYQFDQIELINAQGMLIRTLPFENRIDLSEFNNGIYWIRMIADEYVIAKSFLIKK
ncbi:MAG: T9SS type A sorting domain-containing protein, partial [Bacteroidota bacterium]